MGGERGGCGGARASCVRPARVRLLWLPASLLLIVEERYFALVLPGELLEKLQPRRKMLHKGVLDLIALAVLAYLQQSFLQG